MENQIKKTQDIIREKGKILKDIKKQGIITEEQQKKLAEVMSSDEIIEYVSLKKKKAQDAIKQTRDDLNKTKGFQTTVKIRKKDISLIKQVSEKMDIPFEEAYNTLHGGNEMKKNLSDKKDLSSVKKSKETIINLPPDVATKEKKSIKYFEGQHRSRYLKIIKNMQKLRLEGKISYEDLGGGKYNVIMPYGSKKLRMEFPADTKLADSSTNYTDYDGEQITRKETAQSRLWVANGSNYLEQKEKEGQKLLSEKEFETLISSLLPDGNQEEQILAFMIATGFYGCMWLSDQISDKIGNYRGMVYCFDTNRSLTKTLLGEGSLIFSTFVV